MHRCPHGATVQQTTRPQTTLQGTILQPTIIRILKVGSRLQPLPIRRHGLIPPSAWLKRIGHRQGFPLPKFVTLRRFPSIHPPIGAAATNCLGSSERLSGPPWPCATGAKVLLIERFPRARRPRGWRADFEIAAFLIAKLCFRRNKSAGEHLYLQNFASDGASPSGSISITRCAARQAPFFSWRRGRRRWQL